MFFILSTGRAGSRTLANVLSQSSDAICLHEPAPKLIEESVQYRYGDLESAAVQELLRTTRSAEFEGLKYGEAANRLSLVIPELDAVFPGARYVHLVRDGRQVVSSAMQRGWYATDVEKHTRWDDWRLRGDRAGVVSADDWSAWSPFRKNCWNWAHTNGLIVSDLAAVGSDRFTTLLLEDLTADIDRVAEFVGVEPSDWVISRQNERRTESVRDEHESNVVDRVRGPEDWSAAEQAVFREMCGAVMDDFYPGWSEAGSGSIANDGAHDPPDDPVATDLQQIRVDVAELKVLRGELNRALSIQRIDQVRLERQQSQFTKIIERGQARTGELDDAKAAHQAVSRELKKVKNSESYAIGHAVVVAAKLPRRMAGAGRRGIRTARRRSLTLFANSARAAAERPKLRAAFERMPASARDRIERLARSSVSGVPRSRERTGLRPVRLGLSVAASGSASDFAHRGADLVALDQVHDEPDRSYLDLVLTTDSDSLNDADQRHIDRAVALGASHVVVGWTATPELPPLSVDLSPIGFGADHCGEFVALPTGGKHPNEPLDAPPGRSVAIRQVGPVEDWPGYRTGLQSFVGVLDEPGLHTDPRARAIALRTAAAVGLPVVAPDTTGLDRWLPDEVLAVFRSTTAVELTDSIRREQVSHKLRGLVHDHGSPRSTWDRLLRGQGRPGLDRPSVSVTIATTRPSMVHSWAPMLSRQTLDDFEVIVGCHGTCLGAAEYEVARAHLGDRLQVLELAAELSLGEVLNECAGVASGDLITKWDDDDLYGSGHLLDVVRAYEYSGATLVGKAAEFVYLGGSDVTIRRLKGATEGFSATVCGATLTIDRGDLRQIGGWRRAPRRVDSLLIEDVRRSGGETYRTSGFGFVIWRAGGMGHGHTWSADDEVLLQQAGEHRRGLDNQFTALDLPDDLLKARRSPEGGEPSPAGRPE